RAGGRGARWRRAHRRAGRARDSQARPGPLPGAAAPIARDDGGGELTCRRVLVAELAGDAAQPRPLLRALSQAVRTQEPVGGQALGGRAANARHGAGPDVRGETAGHRRAVPGPRPPGARGAVCRDQPDPCPGNTGPAGRAGGGAGLPDGEANYVLSQGRIVAEGTAAQLTANETLRAGYLGL